MDKLQPELQKYWKTIKNDEEKAFKFLTTFWYYLQMESLEFVFNIVESLPSIITSKYEVTYENNAFIQQNKIVRMLGDFFRFPNES